MSIKNITAELDQLANRLEKEEFTTEDLSQMKDLAGDLYERMVILQYKSLEQMMESEERNRQEPSDDTVQESAEIRPNEASLVREPEVSPNQISLIDSIEEIKEMEKSLNDSLSNERDKSLAQQLNRQPIGDLRSAITINQKFKFISTLFEEDKEAFEQALDKLNGFTSYLEADEYVQNTLKERFDWEMQNPVVQEILKLIERRFL